MEIEKMKKFVIVLFTLSLLVSASACTAEKVEQTDNQSSLVEGADEVENTTDSELTTSDESENTSVSETTTTTKEAEKTTEETSAKSESNISKPSKKAEEKTDKKTPSKKIGFNELKIGMTVNDDTVNSLGTVIDKQNAPSCHFDGNDTIYCYNGFKLYTYMDNGAQKLYLIEIDGSSVKTAKGASIGMTVDNIKSLYGEPEKETGTSIVYSENGANVRFTFNSDEVITLIEYEEK